ncbi:MAG: PEP-CTERM sorting domain-containing protein [Planctomycetota bacterium]|jgi:hypothetical protein
MIRFQSAIVAIVMLSPATASAALPFVNLSNNDTEDSRPSISGSNVAWQGDYQIMLYDGETTTALATTNHFATDPIVRGGKVAWCDHVDGDWEVFLYDGNEITRLTDNDHSDRDVDFDGSWVVWESGDGIGLYDGQTTRGVPDGSPGAEPKVHDGRVVWSSGWPGGSVHLFDGEKTTQLSDDGWYCQYPSICGDRVAWKGQRGGTSGPYHIFLYDGGSVVQLTDNEYSGSMSSLDGTHDVDGTHVVWEWYDGNDLEIVAYDGLTTTQLTDNDYSDYAPIKEGRNIFWRTIEGGQQGRLMAFDGERTFEVVDPVYWGSTVSISGNSVVWEASDGNDWEIYMAVVPEPSTALLTAVALAMGAGLWALRRVRS